MPSSTVDPPTLALPGVDLTQRVIGLTLHRGKFGNRRKASVEKISVQQTAEGVEADKALLGLTKSILVSPELSKINSIDAECNTWLRTRILTPPLAYNVMAVPLDLVRTVEAAMRGFASRRAEAADLAASMYETRVSETRARLAILDDEAYPTRAGFRASFYMTWEYSMRAAPASLELIDADLFESERRKVAEQLQRVASDCEAAMRAGLQQLVDRLMESLTPGPDGSPRRFHPSVVKHLTEFLDTFDARNVTDDALLAPLAQRAKQILKGVDPALLANNTASRPALAARFAEIQAALVPLVGARRLIGFEENEDE